MRTFTTFLIVLLIFTVPIYGAYNIDTSELDNALSQEQAHYIGNQKADGADLDKGLKSLFKSGLQVAKDRLKGALVSAFSVVVVCCLVAVVRGFASVASSPLSTKTCDYAGAFAVLCLTVVGGKGLIAGCADAVSQLDSFSKIVIPIYAVAAAVCKHPAAAVTTAGTSLIFTSITVSLTLQLIIPIIIVFAFASGIGAILENNLLSRLCELIKWLVGLFWKIIIIVFTGYISFSGIISSGADAVSVKAAKMVISGAIPIVGSIVAEATDTILSGAAIVKNGVGIIGFLGVCAIVLVPFVNCFIHYIVFKITAAVAGALSGEGISKTLDGVASAYGMALASLGVCSCIMFISIVVMSAVTMV